MRNILFITIFILSACSVGDKYEHKEFASDGEIKGTLKLSTPPEIISSDWYTIFKDSDLNTLIQKAENSNIDISQAIKRLQQSRHQLNIYSKEMYPLINGVEEYNYKKNNNSTYSLNNINNFQVGFDVSWEIDIWGKGKYISDQYYEIMKQAEYSINDTKLSINSEIIKNYINLRLAQEKLKIARKNLKLQEETLQTVKDKFDAGITDDLALNQAIFSVENTKSTIPQIKEDIERYKNAIYVLLGELPSNTSINLDKYKRNITSNAFKYSVNKLYKIPLSAIRNRADIRIAEQSVKTQNAVVNQAITDLYPTLDIGASFGFISNSARKLFYQNKQIYGYTPNITIPIWHWGMLTNNIELQKSIKEEYLLNYNETMLTAIMEIKDNITFIEETYKTNNHLRKAKDKMKQILDLTRVKYENGLLEFVELARAEQNLLDAENNLIENNAQILQNITSFYKSIGGGYSIKN